MTSCACASVIPRIFNFTTFDFGPNFFGNRARLNLSSSKSVSTSLIRLNSSHVSRNTTVHSSNVNSPSLCPADSSRTLLFSFSCRGVFGQTRRLPRLITSSSQNSQTSCPRKQTAHLLIIGDLIQGDPVRAHGPHTSDPWARTPIVER